LKELYWLAMDLDCKDLGWDSIELEEKEDGSLAGLVGSNILYGRREIYKWLEGPRGSTIVSSPSRQSKRARVLNGTQKIPCFS
jgi:hypothetical protein